VRTTKRQTWHKHKAKRKPYTNVMRKKKTCGRNNKRIRVPRLTQQKGTRDWKLAYKDTSIPVKHNPNKPTCTTT
jgi:hypothetical protein